ncbi:unnamed protein product [Linum tenue]|uniref:DUF4283 domain-containing protein n=1 Tax=Linum tenue TaxID=586396 RepID=A0AAV0H794_9ROSI|nr:unnamed protein product [Linum tenue]
MTLSNALSGSPAPVPSPFPSDQPPDKGLATEPNILPTSFLTTPPNGSPADMLVDQNDPSGLPSSQTSKDSPTITGEQANGPQPRFSYAGVVSGWKTPTQPQLLLNQWTPVGEKDLIPGERNGEPALSVSSSFKTKICAPWQRALVVRLLGTKIGLSTLYSRLRSLWRPTGQLEVLDLDHDCFLVKLGNEQDYFRALTDGPWVIFDHYLVVQQWTPNFKVSDPLPKTMICGFSSLP